MSQLKANMDASADVFIYTILDKLPPRQEVVCDLATTF